MTNCENKSTNKCNLTEYDLKLAEGIMPFSNRLCVYSKDKCGRVVINFSLITKTGEAILTGNSPMFNLPEGFRPSKWICFSLTANDSKGMHIASTGHMLPDGSCFANIINNHASHLHGSIVFNAESKLVVN